MLLCFAAPARADLTGFIGATTTPTSRTATGFGVGTGLLIVGFEFEYSSTAEDLTSPQIAHQLGNNLTSSVAVVTLLGAHHGVRAVPRVYLDAAASLGASPRLTFRKIVLPFALPHIFAGIRVGVGLAWVTIVVAELIDARMPSLGYLLALSGAYPRVPTMLIALATVGALVLGFDLILLAVQSQATRWMRRTA